jgi:hypothetical protein
MSSLLWFRRQIERRFLRLLVTRLSTLSSHCFLNKIRTIVFCLQVPE